MYIQMVFTWDENKDRSNKSKHGISFETAAQVFTDPDGISYPDRIIEGEQRWHAIGLAVGIVVLLVVHTSKEKNGEEEIRIISARKANSRERSLYNPHH